MLQIQDISKTYSKDSGEVPALRKVSLAIQGGEFIAIRGPSGCGKSTLLLTAGGLLKPDQGQVLLDEVNLYQMNPEECASFRARKIGFVFQQFHLIPYLTILENILVPEIAHATADTRQHAARLMEQFQLTPRRDHFPSELSTGEQQRTAMARALLNKPSLILADEPTGNLDEKNAGIVLHHLAEFAKNGGAVLLVTHDARATPHVTRTLKMQDGKMEAA